MISVNEFGGGDGDFEVGDKNHRKKLIFISDFKIIKSKNY